MTCSSWRSVESCQLSEVACFHGSRMKQKINVHAASLRNLTSCAYDVPLILQVANHLQMFHMLSHDENCKYVATITPEKLITRYSYSFAHVCTIHLNSRRQLQKAATKCYKVLSKKLILRHSKSKLTTETTKENQSGRGQVGAAGANTISSQCIPFVVTTFKRVCIHHLRNSICQSSIIYPCFLDQTRAFKSVHIACLSVVFGPVHCSLLCCSVDCLLRRFFLIEVSCCLEERELEE